ncbi:hypothetical protein CPU12_10235 [Malaciobacter molluscorum LMG 25693]|uniref:DUF3883 domain-containing protein n=1 Tax=Malaciobacter molluscorum LMG 25693 TaxID=870501 RepID=A0A2G1DG06_9BACT|nr:DUF3883 domain-containing protein [Malaciobacter molluscorum]AXX91138.1 DUF3883 domain-containing protein [Malaciobacter molluscorum LMG 25693]PHO17417.1 hypothetical protein CPU12_10235 [Malaciobacter molluscorum LMG 25693]
MDHFTKSHHDLSIEEKREIYSQFQDFKNTFLEQGVSYFDKTIVLFDNDDVFDDFESRIIKGYDSSSDNNLDKYLHQLNNASSKFRHFFANLIWLYNFPIRNESKLRKTKINEIALFLNTSDFSIIEPKIPSEGILNYGNLYHSKYADINFIYFFVKHYKQTNRSYNDIINNIDINTLTKEISSENLPNRTTLPSIHILNYLFSPDLYEPIGSREDKQKIVTSFMGDYDIDCLDEDLRNIRINNGLKDSDSLFLIAMEFNGKLKKRKKESLPNILKKAFINHTKKSRKIKDINTKDRDKRFNLEKQEKENKCKILNGLRAEELVYQYELKRINKSKLVNLLTRMDKFNNLSNIHKDIDLIIHYSKNIYAKAPFDILSHRNDNILYIEVKSTTSDVIFFSLNEIIFAYENYNNYEVRIVKDDEIYIFELEKDILKSIYQTIDKTPYTIENISLRVNFL